MTTTDYTRLLAENAALKVQVYELKLRICKMDCRYTMGDVADISGSHCNEPCDRCTANREIDALVEKLKDMIRRHPICYDADADKDCVVCLCEVGDINWLKAELR